MWESPPTFFAHTGYPVDLMFGGMNMEVTLMQVLDAREARVKRQGELLAEFGGTLLCFTMNIAGPVKDSVLIRRGFAVGKRMLGQQLVREGVKILHFEEKLAQTGCEAMYSLACDPLRLKKLAILVEESSILGRLFDMDVLMTEGGKVDRAVLGLEGRKCLICGGPAQVCGRSRVHPVQELQKKTEQVLKTGIDDFYSRKIAALAVQALLYEVGTGPKPGLVDRFGCGSHRDMDFFTFQASAAVLWPYFYRCAATGMEKKDLPAGKILEALRAPGMLAEGEMLEATGGVNTHKGAIFSLGILCAALGAVGETAWQDPGAVLAECAAMTAGLAEADFAGLTEAAARTVGQKLYLRHGITGIRGQAEAGFPAVGQVGLPKLREGLRRGLHINDAGCAALLAMMVQAEDTNMIHRGGYERYRQVQEEIAALLEEDPFPNEGRLRELDEMFVRENLSPGGTADLLAMVYLLHFAGEAQAAD